MKQIFLALIIISLKITGFSQTLKPEDVKKDMKRVADWQIEHFNQYYSNSNKPHHPLAWYNGALNVGMVKWAIMADDNTYWEWIKNIAMEHYLVANSNRFSFIISLYP